MNILRRLLKKENLENEWKEYFKSRLPEYEAQSLIQKNELLRQEAYKMNNSMSNEYFCIVAKIRKNDYELSNYFLSNGESNLKNYRTSTFLRIGKQ